MSEETVSAASGLPPFTLDDYYKMMSELNKDRFDREMLGNFDTYQDFTCKPISPAPILNWDALIEDTPTRERND